ncbi:MAG TPA: ankyrin repeat domain-containing protein [Thermoanaerobaculia bacterium]|nr:ankyrin repeat domain-containing protein [Thermoanaerobaculia bacterium]
MKTSVCCLVGALVLVASSAHADQASARAKLAADHVAFTPDAFLNEVASGNVEHVKLFLEGGIDPAAKNAQSQTALWLAVERQHLDVLQALIAGGVAPNETNAPVGSGGKTIVFAAVDTGDAAYVRELVAAGADAKKANDYEVPPLAEAARTGNLEMCKVLLAAGADPNAAPAGFPLLFGPVNEDHLDVVRLLLESGAKLGEHKDTMIQNAKTPEMRELLEKAE